MTALMAPLMTAPMAPPMAPHMTSSGGLLKLVRRSVPPQDLACEPAAALEDVKAAIERCKPRLVLFSGHSFAGSLAFELPNGRIELPPPELFIEQVIAF